MTAALPEGFLNAIFTSNQQPPDASDTDVTNSEILHKFWKVYDVQSNVTSDHASPRARNLFWRVWSNPRLSQSMTSDRLMRLWLQCSRDYDLTPIETSRALPRESLPHDVFSSTQVRARSSSLSTTSGGSPNPDGSRQTVGPFLREYRFGAVSPAARPPQSAVSVGRPDEHDLPEAIVTSTSPPPTSPGSSTRPAFGRTTSAGRTRQSMQPSAGRSRTRPHITRRKSSSTKSAAGLSTERSPRHSSETARRGSDDVATASRHRPSGIGPPPGFPPLPVPATTSGPVFALPSASSWQSVEEIPENPMTMGTAPSPSASSALVDRDFRGRFVETQKQLSSTNLASLSRMKKTGSVVRFADDLTQDWRKGKEKEALHEDNRGTSRLRSSLATNALVDDDNDDDDNSSDNDHVELPRTKSQLSLLIREKRDQIGSDEIGAEAKPQGEQTKSKGKGKETTPSKEEELLSMGRRDGVTKAGGVQGPKPQRLSEHHDPGYVSSSSPEPLF